MEHNGWIKLHRILLDKAIWKDSSPEQKTILITLLLMANHTESEWEWKGDRYQCFPGQFRTSLESIAAACGKGISIQNVRTALKKFERYGFLTNESTKAGRLITICNWEFYQAPEEERNKASPSPVAKYQQTPNRQLTTNKNNKNDKKEEKERSKAGAASTLPEEIWFRQNRRERRDNG